MGSSKQEIIERPVETRIVVIRGRRVILDSDLAALYGVTVSQLNQQIKRNVERFPEDFVFQLTAEEMKILRSQIVISSPQHGGRRYLPYAFTEHGAIMAANVLRTRHAIEMSIFVVRAFVRVREMILKSKEVADKLDELERKLQTHDVAIQEIIAAIRRLMQPPKTTRQIGFQTRPVDKPKALKLAQAHNSPHPMCRNSPAR